VENLPRRSSTDPAQLARKALTTRFFNRTTVTGEITLPGVPSLLDEYVKLCDTLFSSVGRKFSAEELAHVRAVLAEQLAVAYGGSQRSTITISYEAKVGLGVDYYVTPQWQTLEQAYNQWIETREPPLFGTHPDARVWALASEATDPTNFPVLDVGAGTGRNALALARRGHPVDAVELTAKFAEMIKFESDRDRLGIRVFQNNVFEAAHELPHDYQLILLSEVVPEFRTTQDVRNLFELAARCLAPGGQLVFNTFLDREGYGPLLDDAAREFAQLQYSTIFLRDEMAAAAAGLPLELVSDESVCDYEKANLPPEGWPPTGWYVGWTTGLDVFTVEHRDLCPIDMRWLVYKKTA
jgi:SAM-dependent methyltransferase